MGEAGCNFRHVLQGPSAKWHSSMVQLNLLMTRRRIARLGCWTTSTRVAMDGNQGWIALVTTAARVVAVFGLACSSHMCGADGRRTCLMSSIPQRQGHGLYHCLADRCFAASSEIWLWHDGFDLLSWHSGLWTCT